MVKPVIGHGEPIRRLQRAISCGRVAQAYLFSGPPAIGKRALALHFAQMLLCQGEGHKPCRDCAPCRKMERGIHPDLRLIEPRERTLTIEQVREEIQREVALKPYEGRYRVYIIIDFHRATLAAANCLLKTLEEPPAHAVFLLTATDPAGLPPTIVSRCQTFRLRPPTSQEIAQALEADYGLKAPRARLLARLCEGRSSWAVAAAENPQLLEGRGHHLERLKGLTEAGIAERLRFAGEMAASSGELAELLGLWQSWWRDMLLAHHGRAEDLVNLEWREELERGAKKYDGREIAEFLGKLQKTGRLLEENINPRLALEVLTLELPGPNETS